MQQIAPLKIRSGSLTEVSPNRRDVRLAPNSEPIAEVAVRRLSASNRHAGLAVAKHRKNPGVAMVVGRLPARAWSPATVVLRPPSRRCHPDTMQHSDNRAPTLVWRHSMTSSSHEGNKRPAISRDRYASRVQVQGGNNFQSAPQVRHNRYRAARRCPECSSGSSHARSSPLANWLVEDCAGARRQKLHRSSSTVLPLRW
jgi:hypothetical protein